jgi:diguanylate cyclase (GGDEF)-like protein/PAS domain S-box-containing protein
VAIGFGSALALMLASVAGRDAADDLTRVKRAEQTLRVMQLVSQAVHELQAERGLSIGAALGASFAAHALPTQRRAVDLALARLLAGIDDADPVLHPRLVTAGSAAQKAQAQRDAIDRSSRSTPLEELMQPLSQSVSAWLRFGDNLLRQLHPLDDQYALPALWALIESKEQGGQERALILAALLHNKLDETTINTLQRGFGAQRALLQQAMLVMPKAAVQAHNRIVESTEAEQIEQVRTAVLQKEHPTLTPEQWFALVSDRQDTLQKITDEFAGQIAARIADSRHQAWRNMWLAGALLFLALGGLLLGWLGTRFHHGALRYRALVQGLNGVVWEANPKSWRYTFVSRQAAALSGTPADAWLAEGAMLGWIHEDDRERVLQALTHCVESCEPASLEYRLIPPGCASHWVRNDCTAELHIGQGVVLRGVLTDLSETRQAKAQIDFVERILANTSEAVTLTDADRCILRVNRAFTRITGYTETEVLGKNPRILASGRHGANFYAEMWNSINSIGFWSGEIWNRRKSGEEYPELLSINNIRDEEGAITHYVAVFSDISNHKRDQALIHQLAENDALTGLPNWARFQTCLYDAMKNHAPKGTLAVLLINLDRFRQINECASQAVGDYVLQALAERIVHSTSGNLVARRAADEYGVLCQTLPSPAAAGDLASALLKEITQPVLVLGHSYHLTASIGIAVVDNDPAATLDSDGLLRKADLALSHAKQNGANHCQFFLPEMSARVNERLQLEEGLNNALERGEIFLHYQPQIELLKGNIIGAEALMRWQHPTLGLIAPDRFIPLAENTGQIIALGEWALRTACAQAKRWHDAGFESFRIAVNFSPRQFRRVDWPLLIARVLHETGFPAVCLELEITEGALMHDPAMAKSVLMQVRKLGVAVAIDDFGTGYSSLSYLKDLPVDRLKIDRCFIDGCPDLASDVAIVDTIIDLAGKLGLEVVAEGVETIEHLTFLSSRVCQIGQGYLFSRPLSVEQMTATLLDGRFASRQESAG